MKRSSIITGLGLAASITMVACSAGNKNAAPLDGADAGDAGGALASSMSDAAGGFQSNGGASVTQNCSGGGNVDIEPSLTPPDTDGDGIPDNLNITFNACSATSTNGLMVTLNGTEGIQDSTPSTSDYAFLAGFNLTEDIALGSTSAHISFKGARKASQPAASYKQDDLRKVVTDYASPAHTAHVEEGRAWTATYTPGSAWTPGSTLVAGALDVAGAWKITVGVHSVEAAITTNGILVDPACSTHVVSGTATAGWKASNGQQALLHVVWSGCDQVAVQYVGP